MARLLNKGINAAIPTGITGIQFDSTVIIYNLATTHLLTFMKCSPNYRKNKHYAFLDVLPIKSAIALAIAEQKNRNLSHIPFWIINTTFLIPFLKRSIIRFV